MAIVKNATIKRDIPHEPSEWIEFRTLSISDVKPDANGDGFDAGINMLVNSVVGWSYDEPCIEENIRMLDIATATWAIGVIQEVNHIGEEQGESSAAASSRTTSGVAAGLRN